jgi:hypothetical protein
VNHIQLKGRQQGLSTLSTDASITAKPFLKPSGFRALQEQFVPLRGQTFRHYRMARTV